MENEVLAKFLTYFLSAVLSAGAAVLVRLIYAYGSLALGKARAQKPELVDTLEWVARTAVSAAEQAGAAGLIESKKDYAIEYVERVLEARGLPIDLDMISAAIEAAVYQEINKEKAKDNPPPAMGFTTYAAGGGVAIVPDDDTGALTDAG